MWFWNSNARSTAIVLNSLVNAAAGPEEVRPIVRWLMTVRRNGRWGNTQENAYAMESLVAYYRRYESVVPDFTAVAMLGDETVAREQFKERSTQSAVKELPMGQVLAAAPAGSSRPLTFARDGAGTLFYTTRLRYASDELFQQGLDNGMRIERSFAPYVENGTRPAATSYKAGDLIRVTLTLRLTKERRFVAVTDPLPAGFEPLESWFATTARSIGNSEPDRDDTESSWESWWQRGGFDHVAAPRRPGRAVRHPPRRGPPYLHLRRARHHCRHVPDRSGARGGDVRAGNLRPDADGGDHGAAMSWNRIFRLKPEATTASGLPR